MPNELAEKLEKDKDINNIGDLLIQDIKNSEKEELVRIADELFKEIQKENKIFLHIHLFTMLTILL